MACFERGDVDLLKIALKISPNTGFLKKIVFSKSPIFCCLITFLFKIFRSLEN